MGVQPRPPPRPHRRRPLLLPPLPRLQPPSRHGRPLPWFRQAQRCLRRRPPHRPRRSHHASRLVLPLQERHLGCQPPRHPQPRSPRSPPRWCQRWLQRCCLNIRKAKSENLSRFKRRSPATNLFSLFTFFLLSSVYSLQYLEKKVNIIFFFFFFILVLYLYYDFFSLRNSM